eukprot:m.119508 g.119508  ORF g.119508 m.119508 type:complete len:588 (+) comp9256_c3_seq5:294-2057(+)
MPASAAGLSGAMAVIMPSCTKSPNLTAASVRRSAYVNTCCVGAATESVTAEAGSAQAAEKSSSMVSRVRSARVAPFSAMIFCPGTMPAGIARPPGITLCTYGTLTAPPSLWQRTIPRRLFSGPAPDGSEIATSATVQAAGTWMASGSGRTTASAGSCAGSFVGFGTLAPSIITSAILSLSWLCCPGRGQLFGCSSSLSPFVRFRITADLSMNAAQIVLPIEQRDIDKMLAAVETGAPVTTRVSVGGTLDYNPRTTLKYELRDVSMLHVALLQSLLLSRDVRRAGEELPSSAARQADNLRLVQVMLSHGADPNDVAGFMQFDWRRNGDLCGLLNGWEMEAVPAVACVLAIADYNNDCSAMNKLVRCLDMLLAAGANLDAAVGVYARRYGDYDQHHPIRDIPLLHLPLVHKRNRHLAAAVVTALLDRGADVNAHDARGGSLLQAAVSDRLHFESDAEHEAFVRRLLNRGADARHAKPVTGGAMAGATALHIACRGRNAQSGIVAVLIERGAAVDAVTVNGETALMMLAASYKDWHVVACAEALLAARARVNARDHEGCTALHYLVRNHVSLVGPHQALASLLLARMPPK